MSSSNYNPYRASMPASNAVRIKIITVNPPERMIEGRLRDGVVIRVQVWDTPNLFRWPQQGEVWTVMQSYNTWRLGQKLQQTDTSPLEALGPGDAHLDVPTGVIQVTSNDGAKTLRVDALVQRFTATIGNGALIIFNLLHGFASSDVISQVRRLSDGAIIDDPAVVTLKVVNDDTVRVTFAVAPTTDQYRVTVIG